MKKSFLNRINSVRARRMVSLVLALAFCLSFGGWFVIEGDDAPAVPVCGITEHVHDLSCRETVCGVPETPAHTHGPECYESVLICTDESPEHVHGDGCYQSVLTCALHEGEGHIHDESCYKKVLICEDVSPEHIHDELCYEYSYICGMEEHVHTDECYVLQDETQQDDQDSQDGEIVDGQPLPDVPVQNDPAAVTYCGMIEHTHTPECYDITGALICGMPEHQHYDTCYIDPTAMTYCGMVEHTHTPECYDIAGALVCGLEQHTHTVDCYVQTVYYCGKEEHSHTPTCYNELNELICGLEEHWHTPECLQPIVYYCGKAEHQHTDACYSVEGILTCLIEEHSHSAECLMPPAPVYYCGKEEHVHTDACYSVEGILTCTIEEHLHTVECEIMPEPQADVIETYCGLTEHTHTDDCYAWNCDLQLTDPTHVHSTATCAYSLICMLPEHVHDWKCYISPDAPIICGKEEHTHSDACGYWSCTELMAHEHRPEYGCTWVPVCLKEEHTHGPECYGAPGSAGYGCGLEEHTHGPECYETVYLCGNTDPAHVHDETCPSELRLICTKPEHTHDFMCEVMGEAATSSTHLYIVTLDGKLLPVDNYKDSKKPYTIVKGDTIKVAADITMGKHITVSGNQDDNPNGKILDPPYTNWDKDDDPMPGYRSRYFEGKLVYDEPCKVYLQDENNAEVPGEYFYVKVLEPATNLLYVQTPTGWRTKNEVQKELTGGENGDNNPYPMNFGDTITVRYYTTDYTGPELSFAEWTIESSGNTQNKNRISQKGEIIRTDNSITATFEAVGAGIARIALAGGTIFHDISLEITGGPDAANIYIDNMMIGTKSYDEIDRHTATKMLLGWTPTNYNSETHRLIVYVGQQIDLTCKYPDGHVTTVDNNDIKDTKRLVRTNSNAPDKEGIQAGFFGLNVGSCEVQVKENYVNPAKESLYIDVQYPIYVETAIGEIPKDRIHEYLFVNYTAENQYYITDKNGVRLYVKNSGELDNGVYSGRYVLSNGDELTLVSYSTDKTHRFVSDDTNVMEPVGETDVTPMQITETGVADPKTYTYYRIEQKFKAINENKDYDSSNPFKYDINSKISFNDQEFYLVVSPDYTVDQIKTGKEPSNGRNHFQFDNHFDIEVSDGGKYILTKTYDDGSVERITYEATVHSVNSCKVWSKAEYDRVDVATGEHIGNPLWTLTAADYWRYTTGSGPNGTQNEYTSAYNKDSNGNFIDASPITREVSHGQVYKVIFDLDLDLKPLTIEKSINGVIFGKPEDISGQKTETRQGIAVIMDSKEILDAYNKCPDHSGLDFTLSDRILAAQAKPAARKAYMEAGVNNIDKTSQFQFDIYDSNPLLENSNAVKLRTAKVEDGEIKFNPVEFADEGEFTYYVKEHIPDTTNGITYDDRVLRIKFKTTKHDGDGYMWVDEIEYTFFRKEGNSVVKDGETITHNLQITGPSSGITLLPTFINHAPFELPVTGGGGAGSPRAVGAGLIITGFILMPKGRRRERSGCLRDAARAGDKK